MFRPKLFAFAIQNYWNRRNRQGFMKVVYQAEAVEFLVRVTYYIYRVWEVMKENKQYRKLVVGWICGIFDLDYSFKFVGQLIAELQVFLKDIQCGNFDK